MEDAGEELISLLDMLTIGFESEFTGHSIRSDAQGGAVEPLGSSKSEVGDGEVKLGPRDNHGHDHVLDHGRNTSDDQLLPWLWPGLTCGVLAAALRRCLSALAPHGDIPAFDNAPAWEVLADYFGKAVHHVQQYSESNPRLLAWVEAAPKLAPPSPEVKTLILGDLWPNSIHVNPSNRTVWVS